MGESFFIRHYSDFKLILLTFMCYFYFCYSIIKGNCFSFKWRHGQKKNTHTHRWMVPFERMNRFIIFICLFDDFVIVKFNKFKHILSLPKIIVSGSLGFFFSKTWNDNVCNNKISIICIHFSGRPDNNVRLSS